MIKNFLLILISSFIALILIELILASFYPQARNGSWRIQNEDGVYLNKNTGKSRHEFLGQKEKISITYKFGKYHNRIIHDDKYSTNPSKILVLGDSNVFGWLLDDENTFIAKIQKFFKDYYFINSAAGGFSDTDMYLFIDRYCKSIKPEYILYFIDVDRSIRKKSIKIDNKNKLIINRNKQHQLKKTINENKFFLYVLENTHLMQLIKKIYVNLSNEAYIDYVIKEDPNIKKIKKKIENFSKIENEKKIIKNNKKTSEKLKLKNDFELIGKLFNKILQSSHECNAELIFIDLAWYDKDYNSKIYNQVVENFNEMFQSKDNVNFISIYDEMRISKKANKNYKLEEGHPNTEGNLIIFDNLSNKLKKYLNYN